MDTFPVTRARARGATHKSDTFVRSSTQSMDTLRKKQKSIPAQGGSYRQATTISMLPEDVLLEIFDFSQENTLHIVRKWLLLAHVCHQWRRIIFASPHRLDLQILCTNRTPVRKLLGIWPAFPIVIEYRYSGPAGEGNVIAALGHHDRVCSLTLVVHTGPSLANLVTIMHAPYPVLTHLHIRSRSGDAPILPAEFLGGSAPRLKQVTISGIPCPTIPTLLLSASDLVELTLHKIPPAGYISPKSMAVCLAALPRLDSLFIGFRTATPRPRRIHPPPVIRNVLPALTSFEFRGASAYLEDFVAQLDGPQLDQILVLCLNQLSDLQVTQLSKFIDRSLGPKLTSSKRVHVTFFNDRVNFDLYRRGSHSPLDLCPATTTILCDGIDWQVSHITEVLGQFSAIPSNVVHLKLAVDPEGRQLEGTDDVEWLDLLHQLSTVKTLHVSQELAGHFALTLEDITEEIVARVLPSLDLIYLAGQPATSIEKFVAARQLSDHPVTVIDTETDFDERLESYVSK